MRKDKLMNIAVGDYHTSCENMSLDKCEIIAYAKFQRDNSDEYLREFHVSVLSEFADDTSEYDVTVKNVLTATEQKYLYDTDTQNLVVYIADADFEVSVSRESVHYALVRRLFEVMKSADPKCCYFEV